VWLIKKPGRGPSAEAPGDKNELVHIAPDELCRWFHIMSSSFDSKLFRHYSRLIPQGLNNGDSIVYCLRGTRSNLIILATASCKLTAYYLNVDTFELLDEIAKYNTWVQKCVLTSDNSLLAVMAEQIIHIYHAKMRYILLTKFRPHDHTVNSIIWTSLIRPLEDMHLVTAGKDGTVRFWKGKHILNKKFHDTKSAQEPDRSLGVFQNPNNFHHEAFDDPGHKEAVMSIACDQNDKYLASGGVDYRILLWSIQTGEYLGEYDGLFPPLPLPIPLRPSQYDDRSHRSDHGSLLGSCSSREICFRWI
jgi:WD40 repeat protein